MNSLDQEQCKHLFRKWLEEDGQNDDGRFIEHFIQKMSADELAALSLFCSKLSERKRNYAK